MADKFTLNEELFNEIDMSTLLDQGHRVDMSVYNDSPQEDALEGPQTEEEVGVSHLILDAISCVTEMISMYIDITANTSDQEIIEVINQIAEDNNKHMGMLQGILTNVSPNAEAIQDGVEEVNADEVVTVDPEFIPVEESVQETEITSINEPFGDSDEEELKKALENVVAVYVVDDAKQSPVMYAEEFNPAEDSGFDDEIEVNPVIVDAMLKGLQKCTAIYVEPTEKNKRFMKTYNMKPDDYLILFNQVKSSDFNKAIHSTYPKYKDDVLFVFHCKDVNLNAEVVNLSIYIKVNASKSDEDSMIAISFHDLNQFESLNEDLHDKFKKDVKNAYKQWTAQVEKVEQQRKDLKDKFQDVESEEKKKEYEELIDKLFPMPADFKFEFPKNIEKDDFPFYITYYAEYPIYEPAEGGYYYAGKDAIWSESANSEEEAWNYVNDFINEQEDKTEWKKFSDGYLLRGQYIGEDQSIIIEPRDSYLSAVKGWEPYQ